MLAKLAMPEQPKSGVDESTGAGRGDVSGTTTPDRARGSR